MKIKIKKQFSMTQEDINFLKNLPDNLPDNKLTKKQIDGVNDLYFKYITKNIDNVNMARPMYEAEQSEKWPSGSRVKHYEAKRMILDNLMHMNYKEFHSDSDFAAYFYASLSLRQMYSKLVYYVFSVS